MLGLLVTAALLYAVMPHEREVLEEVLARHDECQVLIIGPSYVGEGISEEAFERESKKFGPALRVCKYAPGGLRGYELRHVLDVFLDKPWPKLKVLVIDISLGSSIDFDPANWFNPRLVDWHTFDSVPWLWHYYTHRRRASLWREAPELLGHFEHLLANYLGIGRGTYLASKLRILSHRDPPDEPRVRNAFRRHRAKGAAYEKLRRRLIREKARARARHKTMHLEWPRELLQLARAHGQRRVVFIVSPILARKPPPARGRGEPVVLDFEDPARYPELYTEDVRGTTSHLNSRGAPIYSALLARALLGSERTR